MLSIILGWTTVFPFSASVRINSLGPQKAKAPSQAQYPPLPKSVSKFDYCGAIYRLIAPEYWHHFFVGGWTVLCNNHTGEPDRFRVGSNNFRHLNFPNPLRKRIENSFHSNTCVNLASFNVSLCNAI